MVEIEELPDEITKLFASLDEKVRGGIEIVKELKENYPELNGETTLVIARHIIKIIADEQIVYQIDKKLNKAIYNILTVERAYL